MLLQGPCVSYRVTKRMANAGHPRLEGPAGDRLFSQRHHGCGHEIGPSRQEGPVNGRFFCADRKLEPVAMKDFAS